MGNSSIDNEFSTGAVPYHQRRGFFSLVFTWIGYVFTVTIMSAGGQLAKGAESFQQAIIAVYIGYCICFVIAMFTSMLSMRTGLSFGLLSRFAFGNIGAKIISFFTMLTLCGWFSINCYLIGSITNVLFPFIPRWITTIIFGILMVFSALKGQKLMNMIGLFATIAVFAVGILAVVIGIKGSYNINELGLTGIRNSENLMTMSQLVTISVGSVICGCCSWAPDIMRFAKDKRTTFSVMIVGLGICGPFMLLIGIIGMLVYGEYDIAYILKKQGFLAFAFIGLVTNVWSTAQGNAYSSSLNLAAIFTQIRREKLLLIFGIVGTIAGLFGLYQYFGTWLGFLAAAFPPMAGVVISDYFISWRGRTPDLEKIILPPWNAAGLISYAVGVSSKWWFPSIGIPAVNAFIIAFIFEALCSFIWLRKQADKIKELAK